MTEENKKSNDSKPAPKRAPRADNKGRGDKPRGKSDEMVVDIEERVVAVNRCAKVVKGGRRFSFSALMIVGDKKGNVGYGLGKAKEVPDAIRKASMVANKNMIKVPLDKGTIPHQILGEYDAGKIMFKPAAEGTGIKAAGACRTILELAGIQDVLTKSQRGNNPHNIVKATFAALKALRSPEQIASARGVESKGLRIK
jgi:small subunit ribosomal protein S5